MCFDCVRGSALLDRAQVGPSCQEGLLHSLLLKTSGFLLGRRTIVLPGRKDLLATLAMSHRGVVFVAPDRL